MRDVYWELKHTHTHKLVLSILNSSNHLYNDFKVGIIINSIENDEGKKIAWGNNAIKPNKTWL